VVLQQSGVSSLPPPKGGGAEGFTHFMPYIVPFLLEGFWTAKFKGGDRMIAEVILKVAGFEKEQWPYRPRPSNAGPERCIRGLCYWAQGIKGKATPDRLLARMADSKWHEDLSFDLIRKSAFQLHSEQMRVECGEILRGGKPFTIRGMIDCLVTDLAGVDRLLEHKAIDHFSFQHYKSEVFPLDYLTQVVLYLVGLVKIQPEINEAILLIKNKNTSQYLEFFNHYDFENDRLEVFEVIGSDGKRRNGAVFDGLYRSAISKLQEVENHREAKTLPHRQYQIGSWQCDNCGFNQTCNSSYEEEFSSFTEGADLSEIEGIVTDYVRLTDFKKRTEKTLDEVKDAIKEVMKAKECKQGKSNGYLVSLSLQKRQSLDKSLIPPEILNDVQKETLVEVLNVKHEKLNKKLQKEVGNV